jgi:hypothetical protein
MRGLIEANGSSSDPGYWRWWRIAALLNTLVLFLYAFGAVAGGVLAYNLFT